MNACGWCYRPTRVLRDGVEVEGEHAEACPYRPRLATCDLCGWSATVARFATTARDLLAHPCPVGSAVVVGTSGGTDHWRGVLRARRGGPVIWQCPHVHGNRDSGSVYSGPAAARCAFAALRVARWGTYDDATRPPRHSFANTAGQARYERESWQVEADVRAQVEGIRAALRAAAS